MGLSRPERPPTPAWVDSTPGLIPRPSFPLIRTGLWPQPEARR